MKNKPFHYLCILTLCLTMALGGCSTTDKDPSTPPDMTSAENTPDPVEKLYNNAAAALDAGKLITAARLFDEVEREYPYSAWATRAQLMAGYAHYKNLRYDEAILALDRFIQLHPGDENIAYAYYLRALCYYEQISDVRRDQKMTELALDNLLQVTNRYPDSKYARDASLKVDLTLDHLAGKEMEIGRYYLIRGHYQSAINRFQKVVDDYQTTTHVPEALHRLTESYLALGIRYEAEKTAAILGHNYPNSSWYKDSYAILTGKRTEPIQTEDKSWYGKTIGRIF